MQFRTTESGIAICPFFGWQSEEQEQSETDVNLVFCSHNDNKDKYEGNCRADVCPLMKE